MPDEPGGRQALSLEGEVVEIFERAGQRVAKIMLKPRTVLNVTALRLSDVHLGDRVVVTGSIEIEDVSAGLGTNRAEPP